MAPRFKMHENTMFHEKDSVQLLNQLSVEVLPLAPVDANSRTTLVLDRAYQPYAFFTARASMRHMMNGRAHGIDASGNTIPWAGRNPMEGTTYSWANNTVEFFDNQPCLRSAPDRITGAEKHWAIPTIVVCTSHFGHAPRRGQNTSLRSLYSIYKGTCQYCLKKIPFCTATKDHVHPKSKGGTNDNFNLVLACRDCNAAKDDIFPYFDVNGKEVVPKNRVQIGVHLPEDMNIRAEWKPYLYISH